MESSIKSDIPEDWQQLLDLLSIKGRISEHINKVKQGQSLKEKVKICYETNYIYNNLKQWLTLCLQRPIVLKKACVAEKFRLKGNSYIKNQENLLALNCYNKSLLYAPNESDELRSAYGNRSYVLTEMNRNRECITDVDRALIGYNPYLRHLKLLLRKGQALMKLSKYSEALQTLEKAISLSNSSDQKSHKLISEINILLAKVKKLCSEKSSTPLTHELSDSLKEPILNFEENITFPCASKSLSLVHSEKKGRYVIATENIKVGDVLFSERPFAFVVLPEMADKYCNYCCKAVLFPVPCDGCPSACFCNETCRDFAIKSYHKWECGGLEVCYSIGIVHLALRVALLGLADKNKNKYKEVTDLVAHIDDSDPTDLFNYAITATLLVIYLEDYTKLFEGPQRRDRLLNFGGVILLHIAQLICNGHAITDIESECESGTNLLIENQVRVATAIYPSVSMLNHSCDPSIINSFFDSLLIARASTDLKKGEEVFNCYGPMAQKMKYQERQDLLLTQYMFVCDCTSCINKVEPISNTIVCESCSSQIMFGKEVCIICNNKINIDSLKKEMKIANTYFQEGLTLMNNGHLLESCEQFKKSLLIYKKHCHKNHQKILECRDCLARVYASRGEEEESYLYLSQNIACIEDMYGKTSVEVGQEILKLLTIATNISNKNNNWTKNKRKTIEKCIELGQNGKFILELSYGDWHPRYKDFCKHLDYLFLCINK